MNVIKDKKFVKGKDFKQVNYRTKKYQDGVVLTNDYGNWLFLKNKDYEHFLFGNISEKLFDKLEKNYLILTDDNLSKFPNKINEKYSCVSQGATLHIVIPTLRCNYTCKYCYAYRSTEDDFSKDMTLETMKKTLDFILESPANSLIVEFTGGEPLLKFDLIKEGIIYGTNLAKKLNKKLFFSLVTNGSLLTEEIINFIIENRIGICVSLDGPKDIHDNNRKFTSNSKSSYDDVVDKINIFRTKKYKGINALPVITKNSLTKWKEIADEYVNQGLKNFRFKYLSNFGFATHSWDDLSYSAEEYLDNWKQLIDYLIELNKKGIEISENLTTTMLKKILQGIEPCYTELMNPCGAVTAQILYDYDGSIYSCDEARTMPEFKIGDVFNSTYKDIISCPVTTMLQSTSELFSTVDNNPWVVFNGVCPLEIYKSENGFITNINSNYRFKIHDGMLTYLFDKIIHDSESKTIFENWIKLSETMDPSKIYLL